MIKVEHRLKMLESSQVIAVEVRGPAPATHLFLCSGRIRVEAARIVERTGMINVVPDGPLPLSLILPDANRQYFSFTANDGTPLRILSASASATFPIIDISQHLLPTRREINSVQVHQQEAHAVLTIYLSVNAREVEVTMDYQASILAGPAR